MKDMKIYFNDLDERQQESIEILKEWLYSQYEQKKLNNNFTLWNWIVDISNGKTVVTSKELEQMRELWDIYSEYRKIEKLNG